MFTIYKHRVQSFLFNKINVKLQSVLGWFGHPIFKNGDYPLVTKDYVAKKDAAAGKQGL